ncbi:vacuolar amino acid permease [Fomitiporia mediterranea MF3/22]|uniref:vacuolar amino acid permease n=1 Tax=Fomitiporia mediterranea (strain MF3/22) TaxID=694068 RepID=UPI0004408D5E|nr:vacuolar amino acid permease [Fomitiporia mediterranea MF3/22]EJD06151.1 vacuolar amino acid permease [Fomitiporia mediterranea MF3/22]
MAAASATERAPLLGAANVGVTPLGASAAPVHQSTKDIKAKPGPLEITRSNRYAILAGIWTATFLSSLNTTLVATLLSSISSEFKRANQASWLGTSYLLATCTFTPLYGRLCNVMGRRGANQLAVASAAIGTLACGLSQNMETLIVARFLSGLGGGGIFTTSQIIVSDMYSIRSRGLAQGVANIFNGLGMGLGGPVGGYISDRFGWRWAFLIQMPLFAASFVLTGINLKYVTPGKGKSAKEVLLRIDYGGTFTLLGSVFSFLIFLSNKFNEDMPWSSPSVYAPFTISTVMFIVFVLVELLIAPEPVLAPFLLQQRIPVLIGVQNFLVANCNFAVMYFFPMWFETVALTSASEAGAHLLPNSISMSFGSLFAGYMMHRTGKYKMINLIFGSFPFIAAVAISLLREDSNWFQMWFSIIPLGFGNAVVLQTTLIALLAHIPHSVMAVGTGFGQLFRGIGQVGGVGIASSIFQSTLDRELRNRIPGPDAEHQIRRIRHSSKLVATLPPELQRAARDSYATSLRAVFIYAAVSTLLAYIVRLPIPEKALEDQRPEVKRKPSTHVDSTPAPPTNITGTLIIQEPERLELPINRLEYGDSDEEGEGEGEGEEGRDEEASEREDQPQTLTSSPRKILSRHRRLSTFESSDGILDLESDDIGGSARSFSGSSFAGTIPRRRSFAP